MKTQLLKYLFLIILMSFSNALMAAVLTLTNVSVKSIIISEYASSTKATIIVKLEGPHEVQFPPNCGSSDDLRLINDAYFFDEVYSLLLSAKLSEKKVSLLIGGTAPDECIISSVELDNSN